MAPDASPLRVVWKTEHETTRKLPARSEEGSRMQASEMTSSPTSELIAVGSSLKHKAGDQANWAPLTGSVRATERSQHDILQAQPCCHKQDEQTKTQRRRLQYGGPQREGVGGEGQRGSKIRRGKKT